MLNKIKNAWKSRTVWATGLLTALAAIQLNLTMLEPVMSSQLYAWVNFGMAMLLMWLRFVTTKPLDEK